MILFVIASLILVTAAESPTSCPVGYTRYSSLCLKFVSESLIFFEATTACDVIDGKIVQITSSEEQESVKKHLSSVTLPSGARDLWLGATDLKEEGNWLYLSSHVEKAIAAWNNWAPGYPRTDTSTNCATLNLANGWKWTTSPCTYHLPFLCEVRLRASDAGVIIG